MSHFLRLVANGKHRGSSGGEKSARKLAIAIREHCLGLDAEAIDGAIKWMEFCRRKPSVARDFLNCGFSQEIEAADDERTRDNDAR